MNNIAMTHLEKTIVNLRNVLRSEGIKGMDSINHCIAFILMKYMDVQTCETYNIPLQYTYDSILNHIKEKDITSDEINRLIFDADTDENDSIIKFIWDKFEFVFEFKMTIYDNIIKIIKSLETLDLRVLELTKDIIGTIYELHLKTGSAGGGMRDLGQYFTHRKVIQYMIELCDPKKIGNEIEHIVDPTCGTGGFLTMTVKYLNKKYNNNINWETNQSNMIGFDIDEDVLKISSVNLLIECNTQFQNLIKRDTLYHDMKLSDEHSELTADVLLCNEPMGITNLHHALCCDRIKNLLIRGTKAEPLFLQLFMEALNENGRCAVVVPDGVLFNESNLHQGTRKKLIEDFNLEKVIELNDKEFFLNTGVKTSILYFVNNGKTTKTSFNSISLTDDEIIEEHIMDVDYDTLVKNNYSLFINKYKISLENRIDGIEYKKLGDICEFLPKSKRAASFGKDDGEFEFFTSSIKIKRCDVADYNQKSLIIGTGGNANIKIGMNFSCSADNFILSNNNDITIKYIYYYLDLNINLLENGFVGSTIKHISKVFVNSLEIPIPSLEVQNVIVEQLDIINENNATCQKQIDEFKKIMKYYVETNTLFGEEKQLGNICEMKIGKKTSKDINSNGNIDFYNGSSKNPVGKSLEEFYDKSEYILLIKDGGAGLHKYGDNIGLGKVFYCKNKSSFTTSVVALDFEGNIKYYYYMLQVNKNNMMDLARYTVGLGHIRTVTLKDYKIRVVDPVKQTEIVAYCDNLQMMIDKLVENIENNNILMKTILENKLKQQSIDDSSDESDDESDDSDDDILGDDSSEPKKKSTPKKKEPSKNVVSDEELDAQHAIADSLNDTSEDESTDSDTDKENLYTEADLTKMTVPKIKEVLKESNIDFKSKDKKAVLIQKYLDA
jgi:restriction endonuclease S subunit